MTRCATRRSRPRSAGRRARRRRGSRHPTRRRSSDCVVSLALGGRSVATRVRAIRKAIRVSRNMGSAALALAYVANGRFDAFLQSAGMSAWDVAAAGPHRRACRRDRHRHEGRHLVRRRRARPGRSASSRPRPQHHAELLRLASEPRLSGSVPRRCVETGSEPWARGSRLRRCASVRSRRDHRGQLETGVNITEIEGIGPDYAEQAGRGRHHEHRRRSSSGAATSERPDADRGGHGDLGQADPRVGQPRRPDAARRRRLRVRGPARGGRRRLARRARPPQPGQPGADVPGDRRRAAGDWSGASRPRTRSPAGSSRRRRSTRWCRTAAEAADAPAASDGTDGGGPASPPRTTTTTTTDMTTTRRPRPRLLRPSPAPRRSPRLRRPRRPRRPRRRPQPRPEKPTGCGPDQGDVRRRLTALAASASGGAGSAGGPGPTRRRTPASVARSAPVPLELVDVRAAGSARRRPIVRSRARSR